MKSFLTTFFSLILWGSFTLGVSAQANNNCASATAIACGGSASGSTTSATTDGPAASCSGGSVAPDVWYSFTGNGQSITASLCTGTDYDSKIDIYTGACGSLTSVDCNDDACGLQSSITWPSVNGTTYLIRVHGFSGATGAFTLSVTCAAPPPPGQCLNTASFGTGSVNPLGATVTISTCNFAGEYATVNNVVNGTMLRFTSSVATDYLTVRSGTPGGPVVGAGLTPLTVTATSSGTYYLHINTSSACGSQNTCRTTTVQCLSCTPPPPPANDNCAGAIAVTVNPALTCTSVTPGSITSATASTGPTSTCGNYNDDVWFSFVATNSTHQVELLNITGTTTDLTHQVLTSCGATTALVCSDPNLSTVGGLTPGNTYYIRVATWTATTGQATNFNVCVKTPPPPPANDLCINAIEFTCNGSVTGTTLFSSSDSAPTCDGFSNTSIGVWYTFTGTGFPVTISSCGGVTWDNKISVYTGSCGALTCVAADDDDCNPGLQAVVDFASTAGTTYYILVHGFGTASGNFTLTLSTPVCNACKGTDPPTVTALTGTSATINWNSVPGTTGYGYTVGTGLLLCPSNSTVINTTSTSANLTGLLPGTDYTVCVRSNTCSNGTSSSAWSSIRFTTPGNCETPSQPTVSGLTTTSATLTWPAVAGVTSYKYSRGSSSTCANGTLTTTGSNTVTLTGLTPGTTYYFCVQSDCGSSVSGFVSARFTTLFTPGGTKPAGTNVGDLMEYSVYPNPANEDINLALNNFPAGKNVNVQIINQLGQTMVTHRFTNESNHVETIRVDQLPDGIYIMSVQSEGTEQKFKKFVKGTLRP